MSAPFNPSEIDRSSSDWGIVISLEERLRRDGQDGPSPPDGDTYQAATLDLVRRVLRLPDAQRKRLMAFLHLASDPSAVEAKLAFPQPGMVELKLTGATDAET